MSRVADRTAFILAQTRPHKVPHVPEITLHVADEAMEIWEKTEEELSETGLPPPFWAFAWAGGQALARYVLDHPEIVEGRRVLDFAAGSGLVAIAAAQAGAAQVTASDTDTFAVEAIAINAHHNGVAVAILKDDLTSCADIAADIIVAGDIFYERDTAERVLGWLEAQAVRGVDILIGDPGRSFLPRHRLRCLASYQVPVLRSLEDADIKNTSVWQLD